MNEPTTSPPVGLQRKRNGKRLGGCTGKGWLPGQSGNPSGKRKGCVSLTARLKRDLTDRDARRIVRKLIEMALGGDLRAVEIIFERLDAAEVEERISRLEECVQQPANRLR